ncbi:MAG: winged helix-turn-helix domain-containing protein [Holophagaceae bacterium]|nr:winged helix-turn-helix domain-containing protein [Holophagaceae bacterium]
MYHPTHMVFRRYRFDNFEVDTRTGLLRQAGSTVPLQDVPFRFLAALLEHPGELRSRDELRSEIWPGDVNLDFEGALRTAALKVRHALGDSSKEPRFIETLPGRGFRFTGEVEVEMEQENFLDDRVEPHPSIPSRRHYPVWAATVLLASLVAGGLWQWKPRGSRSAESLPAPVPTVVALPAKVFGAPDSAFLTDAVPDTLSTLLAQEVGLDTKVPPSSGQVEKIHGDIPKIAEAYKADFLILTTVTAEGDRLLLNVKLAEAATQKVRWASQYEATRDNYNGLLRDAARALTAVIKPGSVMGTGGHPPFNSYVELALREGKYFQRQYSSSKDLHDFDLALSAYRKAQSMEPGSALLAAEIAWIFQLQHRDTKDAKAWAEAEQWVARALDLDPRCGLAWTVRSMIEINRPTLDQAAAVEYIFKAARFAPNDARTFIKLGSMSPTAGFQAATGSRAVELDPMNPTGYAWIAMCLAQTGRAGDGVPVIERAIRIEPEPGFHSWMKFYCLFHAGRFDEARQAYSEADWRPVSRLMRFLMAGDTEGGKGLARKLTAQWRKDDIRSIDWANLAMFYGPLLVRLGMDEEALWLLDKCTVARLAPAYDWLLTDPDMQKLKADPRYAKALAASRKYAVLFIQQAETAQSRGEYPKSMEKPLDELRALLARNRG